MARRLSITVPDELWDELTHLDSSPSGLVQRALRCLSDKEGPGAGPTPLEAAAADIPYWQDALDELAAQATELRAEGYEAVIMAFHDGIVGLAWLDRIVQDYRPDELPQLLSKAADYFLRRRHVCSGDPTKPVQPDEANEVLFGSDGTREVEWDEDHRDLLEGLCRIITIQERGHLRENANGDHFRLARGDYPSTDIPYSLFEGMASALFDTAGAVRRRVRSQSNPAELGSFLQ